MVSKQRQRGLMSLFNTRMKRLRFSRLSHLSLSVSLSAEASASLSPLCHVSLALISLSSLCYLSSLSYLPLIYLPPLSLARSLALV